MTELQVGFLYKAAAALRWSGVSQHLNLLRSYYLMRCKDITKGYGLPENHFSSKVRCSKCCIEWNKETITKVKAIKLSRRQRWRIRSRRANKSNQELIDKRKQLLNSNEIEQICSFCKKSTFTTAAKPKKLKAPKPAKKETLQTKIKDVQSNKLISISKVNEQESVKTKKSEDKKPKNKSKEVNVYSVSKDIFSLNNRKNVLPNTVKEEKQIIKNNKKKKDKFAGLCEKAVLATAKMKERNVKQNKLNLFLKPST